MANLNYNGDWVKVTSISGKQPLMLRGEFIWPTTTTGLTRHKNKKLYIAMSDREYLSIGPEVEESCEVIFYNLSRDESDTFENPMRVAFRGGRDNPVLPGSSLSWWHLSSQDKPKSQIKESYKQIFTSMERSFDYWKLNRLGSSSSPALTNNFSRGYLSPSYRGRVPKARYHCGLTQLIDSYKRVLNIGDIEFRIHGTTFYQMEVMHSLLVCPKGKEPSARTWQLNDKYPLLEVVEVTAFSARGQYKAPSAKNVVSIQKNEEGEYRIIWRPFCTRSEDGYDPSARMPTALKWDHVTIAFLMPPRKPQRLPLPVPYLRQDKNYDSDDITRFSSNIIKVTRDNANADVSDDDADASDNDADPYDIDDYDYEDPFIDDSTEDATEWPDFWDHASRTQKRKRVIYNGDDSSDEHNDSNQGSSIAIEDSLNDIKARETNRKKKHVIRSDDSSDENKDPNQGSSSIIKDSSNVIKAGRRKCRRKHVISSDDSSDENKDPNQGSSSLTTYSLNVTKATGRKCKRKPVISSDDSDDDRSKLSYGGTNDEARAKSYIRI